MSGKSIEREKVLEGKLAKKVRAKGGLTFKFVPLHVLGLPDRICLFPGGRMMFVEVKTSGRTPRLIQSIMHTKLRDLGFRVETVDTTAKMEKILGDYAR